VNFQKNVKYISEKHPKFKVILFCNGRAKPTAGQVYCLKIFLKSIQKYGGII